MKWFKTPRGGWVREDEAKLDCYSATPLTEADPQRYVEKLQTEYEAMGKAASARASQDFLAWLKRQIDLVRARITEKGENGKGAGC